MKIDQEFLLSSLSIIFAAVCYTQVSSAQTDGETENILEVISQLPGGSDEALYNVVYQEDASERAKVIENGKTVVDADDGKRVRTQYFILRADENNKGKADGSPAHSAAKRMRLQSMGKRMRLQTMGKRQADDFDTEGAYSGPEEDKRMRLQSFKRSSMVPSEDLEKRMRLQSFKRYLNDDEKRMRLQSFKRAINDDEKRMRLQSFKRSTAGQEEEENAEQQQSEVDLWALCSMYPSLCMAASAQSDEQYQPAGHADMKRMRIQSMGKRGGEFVIPSANGEEQTRQEAMDEQDKRMRLQSMGKRIRIQSL